MPDYDAIEEQAIQDPASTSVDGQSVSKDNILDTQKALNNIRSRDALSGTNENGGPVSGWNLGVTRAGKYKPPGAV